MLKYRIIPITTLFVVLIANFAHSANCYDDFSSASAGWVTGSGWERITTSGQNVFRGDCQKDSLAWRSDCSLGANWIIDVDLRTDKAYSHDVKGQEGGNGGKGAVGFVLTDGAANPTPLFYATIEHHPYKTDGGGLTEVKIMEAPGPREPVTKRAPRPILTSRPRPGADTRFHLRLKRNADQNHFEITVNGDSGFRYRFTTPDLNPDALAKIKGAGLSVNMARAEFANFSVMTENSAPNLYRKMAINAVEDLTHNFWTGDYASGQIINTWGFPAAQLPDPRGALWDRGMFLIVMENLYQATGDPTLLERIRTDWKRILRVYKEGELEQVGQMPNPASDDAGWNAWAMLAVHRATGDKDALDHAEKLVNASYERWSDNVLHDGMLWYNDKRQFKSSYNAALVLDALTIYTLTNDKSFLEKARGSYDWMESHLLRPDGLYWVNVAPDGPAGKERPDDIHEAGSVTFLCGNMMMGILHARFYRMTGDEQYLKRALRTAEAISNHMTDGKGVLLDDRDARTNGTFAGEWVADVLTLPGIDKKHSDLILATARSIYEKDRTPDGYYGGAWSGPADGPASVWSVKGVTPENACLSASSANVIVAAARMKTGPEK